MWGQRPTKNYDKGRKNMVTFFFVFRRGWLVLLSNAPWTVWCSHTQHNVHGQNHKTHKNTAWKETKITLEANIKLSRAPLIIAILSLTFIKEEKTWRQNIKIYIIITFLGFFTPVSYKFSKPGLGQGLLYKHLCD